MREQFLKIAAKQQGTTNPGFQSYPDALAEKLKKIEDAAKAIGLKF